MKRHTAPVLIVESDDVYLQINRQLTLLQLPCLLYKP